MKVTDAELSFIEEVGVVFEQTGLPRMAGRLFGWLLIADPPYQSPGELTEVLQASKGSISTTVRLLAQMGFIERHVIAGSRHDHFRLTPGAVDRLIQHGLVQEIRMFRELADRGLDMTKALPARRKTWLKEIRNRYAYLEDGFPALLEEYRRKPDQ